jgi:hypothetical protein
MAIDPVSRRAEGVEPLKAADFRGSPGKNGEGVDLPTATYNNPGPTANLRGFEANTNWTRSGNEAEPVIQVVVAGETPAISEPFDTRVASGITVFVGGFFCE